VTDLALGLLRQGYGAVELDRRARSGGDTYETRMAGRRAVVVRGPAGAELFYDESLVQRTGAIPFPLRGLLFGRGAIHGLDDEAHDRRKQLFFDVLAPDRVRELMESTTALLEERVAGWTGRSVRVFDELVEVYGDGVMQWAGLPLSGAERRRWSRELATIVNGFGGGPRRYPRAWVARTRADRWARGLVRSVRQGRHQPPEGSALALFAASGLDDTTAAVELLNILRPTIAVSWLGMWAALYLDESPHWRVQLDGPTTGTHHVAFAQEVRRSTPFVPVLAGKLRRRTTHEGVELREGDRVVLDVWGTDQATATWDRPEGFTPERFLRDEPGPYDFLPQGGGLPTGHRCPGEPFTVLLLAETVRVLASVEHRVVSSHDVDLARMPTMPEDGLLLAPRG
jgi:fatty-acid peroxygenase